MRYEISQGGLKPDRVEGAGKARGHARAALAGGLGVSIEDVPVKDPPSTRHLGRATVKLRQMNGDNGSI